jgi:type VI secretion system protein ImpC
METLLERLQAKAVGHQPSLPLKLLVISDCIGTDEREFPLQVTATGASGLLETLHPHLHFTVENKLQKGGARNQVDLEFRRFEDFSPESFTSRIDILSNAVRDGNPLIGDQLDEILHHPDFQRMEACWLGLERLCLIVIGLMTDSVQLEVLPATRKNLKESFHKKVFEPEYQGRTDIPLSAVYFDFRFSHEPADLPLLEALAGECASLQIPMIAAASPAFFQLKNIAHLPNIPDIAGKFQVPAYANWKRFQANPDARWVCLTANRYLAREPYELSGDSDSSLDYKEKTDASHPDSYLWADAGWLVFSNLARSFATCRHCVVIDGMSPDSAHFHLPVRPFPKKANVFVPSPTEILIDDDKAWEIVRSGITMLVGISDGAVATFPLIVNVYRARPGILTVESALSYQLIAGHLSHYLMSLYGKIPAEGGPEALDSFFKEKLNEFLIPFTGEKPEDTVYTEIATAAGEPARRVLNLTLKPLLKLQGKDVDFKMQLAL